MFFDEIFAFLSKTPYLCIVFFMVLDLRLMKIGLSGDNPSFFLFNFHLLRKMPVFRILLNEYLQISKKNRIFARFLLTHI